MKSIIRLAQILVLVSCTLAIGCAVFDVGQPGTLQTSERGHGLLVPAASRSDAAIVDVQQSIETTSPVADQTSQAADFPLSVAEQEFTPQESTGYFNDNDQVVGSAVIRGLPVMDESATAKPLPVLDEQFGEAKPLQNEVNFSAERIGNIEPVERQNGNQHSVVSGIFPKPAHGTLFRENTVIKATLTKSQKDFETKIFSPDDFAIDAATFPSLVVTVDTEDNDDNKKFSFDGEKNLVLTDPDFDLANKKSYTVTFITTAAVGDTAAIKETLTLSANLAPTEVSVKDAPESVLSDSNLGSDLTLGLLTVTDPDSDDFTFQIKEGEIIGLDTATFKIIDQKELAIKQSVPLTQKSYSVALIANDGFNTFEQPFTINIIDAPPAQIDPLPISVVTVGYTDVDDKVVTKTVVPSQDIPTRPKGAFTISGTMPNTYAFDDHYAMLLFDGNLEVASQTQDLTFQFAPPNVPVLGQGPHSVSIYAIDKKTGQRFLGVTPFNFNIHIRTSPVSVLDVDANEFSFSTQPYRIKVTFNTGELKTLATTNFELIRLEEGGGESATKITPTVKFQPELAAATLAISSPQTPGNYRLRIKGISDTFGNALAVNNSDNGGSFDYDILKPVGGEMPSSSRGISGSAGEFVAFPEFVRRPDVPDGFNPNDKVETRVVRLYYYRDAHRIAQIVNRKVKSYNRAAVDTYRQLADKARGQAEQRMVARQSSERAAIIAAQKTRAKEGELQRAQNSLNASMRELAAFRQNNPDKNASDPMVKQLSSLVDSFSGQVNNLQAQVQNQRDQEVQANEQTQQAEAQEKLAREEQFRREVAAAHADPDTYAPAKLNSTDPVEQVSVSVVGEGLIQLRGPLKGINLIRTAIDQLDSPVGQVRVSIHTIQINGEKADRMEKVAKQVQTYIDHARFLTMRSSEMLRKAVVQVASRRAEEASALFPGDTQMDRDARYIEAFFGKDFIDELRAMDSEFLHTGNKLLSLHSMDTTSLASALNMMALAKNSTRIEIFAEFDSMLQSELPQAEMNYFEAGWTCPKKKSHFHRCKDCQPDFCPMAQNARFESLRGFFDMQIMDDNTMTPLQREFIRLAQIFKSRLITEMELKQRVMERAIIEERLGNRNAELQAAKNKEGAANRKLQELEASIVDEQVQLITVVTEIQEEIQFAVVENLNATRKALADASEFKKIVGEFKSPQTITVGGNRAVTFTYEENRWNFSGDKAAVKQTYDNLFASALALQEILLVLYEIQGPKAFASETDERSWRNLNRRIEGIQSIPIGENSVDANEFAFVANFLADVEQLADPSKDGPAKLFVSGYSNELSNGLDEILGLLSSNDSSDPGAAYREWLAFKNKYLLPIFESGAAKSMTISNLETKVESVAAGFRKFLQGNVSLKFAEKNARLSRRPLDHKKFLDMLIDDLEEKYIELLDGTRAQVANIDNYLKRVTTALDDDFNTQFYYPAFKYVREASTSYDVQFGQTETTTVLANNREFAKADPSASMEFDLPKRDILISEGINGAKAMMNDVGALANDPTFLAMAKLKSPNSGASPPAGSTGGNAVVRSVLPGLGGTTSEQIMSQNANGGQQFGSNLENLIPDPAVYKFETGTGFEIRPVIQPDGQAVVFDFNYMYSTQIREPVRADEKHLGRIKRHYIDTDVQLSNFELREVSRYSVALKAARTSRGVPGLEDIPAIGVLFRPLPSDESSLQQNLIMAQATIFPTLFDLMGLRWAPVVSDLDPMKLSTSDFVVRNRHRMLENRVYDEASGYVDQFLRIPDAERRMDLYRSQEAVPYTHPNGYRGPGLNIRGSQMQEGYQPERVHPDDPFVPEQSIEGAPYRSDRRPNQQWYDQQNQLGAPPVPGSIREPESIELPSPRYRK